MITKNMTFKERILARKAAREAAEAKAEAELEAAIVTRAAEYGMSVAEYDEFVTNLLYHSIEEIKNMGKNL